MNSKSRNIVIALIVAALLLGLAVYYLNRPKTYRLASHNINSDIKVDFPTTGNKKFDNSLKQLINEEIDTFKDIVGPNKLPHNWRAELIIDYETFVHRLIKSYKFTIFSFTGGAHPMTSLFTKVLDTAKGKEVKLSDLFQPGSPYIKRLSELTIADLSRRDNADKKWIKLGAGPDPAHFQKFVLSEREIILFFDPYEVACYAAGPQTVKLPLSALRDVWRKNAP